VKKNIVKRFGVPEEKIIQIYNPLDFEELGWGLKSEMKYSYQFPADAKVFLYVGRWSNMKGVDLLLEVFNKVFKVYQNVYLVIISDIPNKGKKKIEKLSRNFIIIRPQGDIRKYYLIANAVVLPSKEESFPFVMLEAGFYKKLFIGTNTGGIGEFIENGINGLLFEKDDKHGFQKILESILENKINYYTFGENLYRKVQSLPSLNEYVERILEIYIKLYKR